MRRLHRMGLIPGRTPERSDGRPPAMPLGRHQRDIRRTGPSEPAVGSDQKKEPRVTTEPKAKMPISEMLVAEATWRLIVPLHPHDVPVSVQHGNCRSHSELL